MYNYCTPIKCTGGYKGFPQTPLPNPEGVVGVSYTSRASGTAIALTIIIPTLLAYIMLMQLTCHHSYAGISSTYALPLHSLYTILLESYTL